MAGVPLWVLLLVVAVLGAVAVVVTGLRGRGLEPPAGPAAHEGAPGPAAAVEEGGLEALERARFPVVVRGYRPDEVEAVLDRVLAELHRRDRRIAELERLLAQQDRRGGEPGGLAEPREPREPSEGEPWPPST